MAITDAAAASAAPASTAADRPAGGTAPSAATWLRRRTRPARAGLLQATAAGLLAGWSGIAFALGLAAVIHAVAIDGRHLGSLGAPLALIAAALPLRALGRWLQGDRASRSAQTLLLGLRRELLDKITAAGPARLDGRHRAELAATVTTSVDALEAYVAHYLPQQRLAVLLPSSIVIVVALHDWLAALLLLFSAPLIPLFMALVGWGAEALAARFERSRARSNAVFADRLRALAGIRLLGAEAEATAQVRAHARRLRDDSLRVLRVAFLSSAVLEFFAAVAVAAVAIYVGFGLLGYIRFGPADELTLYRGLAVLLLAPEFFAPLRQLAVHYHDRAAALGAAELLRTAALVPGQDPRATIAGGELPTAMASESATAAPVTTEGQAADDRQAPFRAEIRRVRLCRGGRAVLADFDLRLHAGELLALAGPSGCGKTSVLHLLAGHLQPDAGQVLVAGAPPGQPGSVAWLSQTPFLARGSIARNIALGRAGARREQIRAAAAACGVDAFLDDLPQGLDSIIGARGLGLSGGEAQRVALARAWLSQAPILLLDEPTTGLDDDAAAAVIDALETLRGAEGRSLVVASHDPRLLRRAQRVVRMLPVAATAGGGRPR